MSRAETIAKLNDQLRARLGIPVFLGPDEPKLGTVFMTAGIAALEPEKIIDIWMRVRRFDDFTEDNDPYGEHDFGSIALTSGEKIFWKVDYYADETYSAGAEDPADAMKSFRVLTIMLAQEY